ncbi:uncharacterized protein [Euwallacea fornicatus]|uniref:uncharacterized protein isoform X3 n=1 Tax=Euwallacea fornicatus TaxID=995702 RepID=UPI00338D714D
MQSVKKIRHILSEPSNPHTITTPIRASAPKILSAVDVSDMNHLTLSTNGSIEEVHVWNNLMDTMVTFIQACTHFMKIIANKVRAEYRESSPKEEDNLNEIIEGFEQECQSCRPSPSCGRDRGVPSKNILGTTFAVEKSVPQSGKDDRCTCAEIRTKRLEEKKDRFSSSKNKPQEAEDEEQPPEDHAIEVICGWDATLEHRMTMVRDIVKKLGNVQQEILRLQEALVKLQKIEAFKRMDPHGGLKQEALCRQIMKDNAAMAAAQRTLSPLREQSYPNGRSSVFPSGCEPQWPHQEGFNTSIRRSDMGTSVMPPIISGGARMFHPVHTFTTCNPLFMETSADPAMDMDRTAISNNSRIETCITPNIFPPRGCPCFISSCKSPSGPYGGEYSSMETSGMRSPVRPIAKLVNIGRFSSQQEPCASWRESRVDTSTPSQTLMTTSMDGTGFFHHPFMETRCTHNVFPSRACHYHIGSIRSTLKSDEREFDPSIEKSGKRTPIMTHASSRGERESYPVNTSTISSPPYVETQSQPAVDIDKTFPSSQSSVQALSTSNVLPPRDSSLPWNDKKTPVRAFGSSRARKFSPVHTSTPAGPPLTKIPPESGVKMDRTGTFSASPGETSRIPNVFSPKAFSSDISPIRSSPEAYEREFDSSMSESGKRAPVMPLSHSTVDTSTPSSLLAIKTSSRKDKDSTPDAVYWSRVAKYGDPDVEDEQRETNVRSTLKSDSKESPTNGE